ncbi:MAG: M23 family metallopeptidase [Pseudomonadota bacterium]
MRVAFRPDFVRGISCAVLAMGCAIAVTGCSDQSTRFNYPALGMGSGSEPAADYATTASLPENGGYSGTQQNRAASYTTNQTRTYGAASSRTPASYAQGPRITVQQGDTLSSLSQRYGVPIGTIQAANNLPDARLRPGQMLVMPGANMAAAQRAPQAAPAPQVQTSYAQPASSASNIVVPSMPSTAPAARPVTTTTIAAPNASSAARAPQSSPTQASAPSGVASNGQLPTPEPLSGNSFRWPVKGRIISGFGTKSDGGHNDGINISVPQGTPVKAAENGVVAYSGNELKGYGNLVLVRHANNWVSAYANNEQVLVKRGEKVSRGQVIAKAGTSGDVSQPQVHFELRKGSRPVDPTKYMSSMAAQAN